MGVVQHLGQVYVPIMNTLLMGLCLIVVGAFKSSANIGKAYGKPCRKMHLHLSARLALIPCLQHDSGLHHNWW